MGYFLYNSGVQPSLSIPSGWNSNHSQPPKNSVNFLTYRIPGFSFPSLVEIHPIYEKFSIQPKTLGYFINFGSSFSANLLLFCIFVWFFLHLKCKLPTCLQTQIFVFSTHWDCCSLLGVPLPALQSRKCLQAEIWGDHGAYLTWFHPLRN